MIKIAFVKFFLSKPFYSRGRPMKVMLSDQPGIPIKFAYWSKNSLYKIWFRLVEN